MKNIFVIVSSFDYQEICLYLVHSQQRLWWPALWHRAPLPTDAASWLIWKKTCHKTQEKNLLTVKLYYSKVRNSPTCRVVVQLYVRTCLRQHELRKRALVRGATWRGPCGAAADEVLVASASRRRGPRRSGAPSANQTPAAPTLHQSHHPFVSEASTKREVVR